MTSLLKTLKNRKASGPDAISNRNLLHILNIYYITLDPNSCRPISLLSNMGKLLEQIILDFLLEHEHVNNMIIPEKFGFRSDSGFNLVMKLALIYQVIRKAKTMFAVLHYLPRKSDSSQLTQKFKKTQFSKINFNDLQVQRNKFPRMVYSAAFDSLSKIF